MRVVPNDVTAKIAERFGTEPIVILNMMGHSYASKEGTYCGFVCEAKIKEIGPLQSTVKLSSRASVDNLTVTLIDHDTSIKGLIDTSNINDAQVELLYTYEGCANYVRLFMGKVLGTPAWSEGERTLTFTVEGIYRNYQISHTFQENEMAGLNPDAIGKTVPFVCGKPAHVPALLAHRHSEGALREAISLAGDVYNLTASDIQLAECTDVRTLLGNGNKTLSKIYVTGGNSFPQNTPIRIIVNEECVFGGTMNGEEFTVSAINLPLWENVPLGPRDTGDVESNSAVRAAQSDSAIVAWLPVNDNNAYLPVLSCFCTWSKTNPTQESIHICIEQHKNRLIFDGQFTEWINSNGEWTETPRKLGANDQFSEIRKISKTGLVAKIDKVVAELIAKIEALAKATDAVDKRKQQRDMVATQLQLLKIQAEGMWSAKAGSYVRLWAADDPDIYLANIVPSSAIHAVYGIRLINGKEHFVPIPKHYYKTNLNYHINGIGNTTAIFIDPPLNSYNSSHYLENWKEEIYVTLTSETGSNTADQIKYILLNNAGFSVDTISFGLVATAISKFPSHFALLDNKDTLQVVEEMAWQARCALHYTQGFATIHLLSRQYSSLMTLETANTLMKSGGVAFTATEEIVTAINGRYYPDYRPRFAHEDHRRRHEVAAWNNINLYGTRQTNIDFYIYNAPEYVAHALEFWMIRKSNTWRVVKVTTFHDAVPMECFDTVTVSIPQIDNGVNGEIIGIEHDLARNLITLAIWLPIPAGYGTPWAGAYQDDTSFVTPANPADNLNEVEYDIQNMPVTWTPDRALRFINQLDNDLSIPARMATNVTD